MPLRPICPAAVAFAYIMIACGNGDIQVFLYSGDFTMEQLARCFASLISGRPTIMEGAWGKVGYWMGSASCLYNYRLISFKVGYSYTKVRYMYENMFVRITCSR